MFKFSELRQIHLEISNNCQASCPMCSRNIHGGLENPLIKISNWSLDQFKTSINNDVLLQIQGLYFCGNFGDPLLNNDLIDMIEYTVSVNPAIDIRIHTNGSLRSKDWWRKLALVMPKNHSVIFAIDGLSQTHSLYRIGTDYHQILKNATAFIQAGGFAEWAFIRFKHNEHEVDAARNIATGLGFQRFTMKDSSRFLKDRKFQVLNSNGDVEYYLEPSTESTITFVDRATIENYKRLVQESVIDCQVLKNKEIYIDAHGKLFPCCWIGNLPYSYAGLESDAVEIRSEMTQQYKEMLLDFGGEEKLDTTCYSIKDILESHAYQTLWSKYWSNPKMITCAKTCGVNTLSKPTDQFTRKEKL